MTDTDSNPSPSPSAAAESAMRDFKRGFAKVDRESLERAVTDDFEWHLHWFEDGPDGNGDAADQPTGRILTTMDEVMAEIERRRDHWSELRYADVEERYTDDLVVQTFVVSGIDANGKRFNSAAVDLYPIRDGRIVRKQTYWKQPRTGTD